MSTSDREGDQSHTFKLYKRRWAFLFLLAVLQLPGGFSYVCFGQISKIFVIFFRVTHVQTDWLTLSWNLSPVILAIPFSWVIFSKWAGFRYMCLTIGAGFIAGYSCLAISLAKGTFFPLMLIGQLLNGIASTLLLALPPIFASLWFPEHEVGTAIAVNVMSFYAGSLLALTVPENILTFPYANGTHTNETWLVEDRTKLAVIFSFFVLTTIPSCAFVFFYVTDRPPTPPTRAQEIKTIHKKDGDGTLTSRVYVECVKRLLKNRTYMLGCVTFGILFQISTVEVTMMAQMLSEMFVRSETALNANVIGGYVVATFFLGSLLGSLAAGKLVDNCKRYKVLSILSCVLSLLFSLAELAGFAWNCLPVIFASMALFGATSQPGLVAIYDIVTQETYPIDETFVSIWLTGIQNSFAIFFGEIGRVLFLSFGGFGVLSFQSASLLASIALSCMFTTENKRLNVEPLDDHRSDEESARRPLISAKE